jgi:hypothetical protein
MSNYNTQQIPLEECQKLIDDFVNNGPFVDSSEEEFRSNGLRLITADELHLESAEKPPNRLRFIKRTESFKERMKKVNEESILNEDNTFLETYTLSSLTDEGNTITEE